jgi:hypothetical protein
MLDRYYSILEAEVRAQQAVVSAHITDAFTIISKERQIIDPVLKAAVRSACTDSIASCEERGKESLARFDKAFMPIASTRPPGLGGGLGHIETTEFFGCLERHHQPPLLVEYFDYCKHWAKYLLVRKEDPTEFWSSPSVLKKFPNLSMIARGGICSTHPHPSPQSTPL